MESDQLWLTSLCLIDWLVGWLEEGDFFLPITWIEKLFWQIGLAYKLWLITWLEKVMLTTQIGKWGSCCLPLLGESGFALRKPHQQASALSAECYLSNGFITICQFGEEYMDLDMDLFGYENKYGCWYI